jgi:oligosaccharyltransferase complex subunit alpha (ribophorin I)
MHLLILIRGTFWLLQVYYEFNPIFMLAEPLMLVSAALLFFVACIAYLTAD